MNSNTLEFFVKMRDLMSGGLAKMASTAQKAFSSVQKQVDNTNKHTKVLGQSYDELTRKIRATEQVIQTSRIPSQIREARKELQSLKRMAETHIGNTDAQSSRRGLLGGGLFGRLAPAAMLAGALAFGGTSVNAAMNFGATQKSFEVLTGSKSMGKDLSNQLNTLQQNTILGPEVFKAAQTMMGFGVQTEKVLPTIKMLGDVSMGDAQKLESLTLAFSQVTAAGRLQGQDLLQLINAGWNPLQQMVHDKVFPNMMAAKTAMEKGAISAGMVETALQHATGAGGKFNGMMEQLADTSYGKMQILQGQWENFKIQFGNALMPVAESLLDVASKTMDWLNISKSVPDTLRAEQGEINGLVRSITTLNEGNNVRTGLLDTLLKKYPDLFSGIDKEHAKNSELLKILNDVNAAYNTKIALASASMLVDTNKQIVAKEQGEWIRNQAIADAFKRGDTQAAKALQTWDEGWFSDPIRMSAKIKEYQRRADMHKRNMDIAQGNVDKGTIDLASNKSTPTAPSRGSLLSSLPKSDLPTSTATATGNTATGIGRAAASGGPRVININGVKFADKIEIHGENMQDAYSKSETKLQEMYLRILNSGATVQSN